MLRYDMMAQWAEMSSGTVIPYDIAPDAMIRRLVKMLRIISRKFPPDAMRFLSPGMLYDFMNRLISHYE